MRADKIHAFSTTPTSDRLKTGALTPPDVVNGLTENMYIYYEGSGALERLPGFRKIQSYKGKIHSISVCGTPGEDRALVIHAGERLYLLPLNEVDNSPYPEPIAKLCDSKSYAFSFGPLCFITDGERLVQIEPNGDIRTVSEAREICGCRCAAVYNGRLFMSGNPELPGRVFYSTEIQGGDISFSKGDCFTEGTGRVGIASLISYGGYLWVFKSADDGCGAIICRRADGESCTVEKIISHNSLCYDAIAFGGELVFVGDGGVMTLINPLQIGKERLSLCSAEIAENPVKENLASARLGIWQGYLTLFVGERIYLADPGAPAVKYVWHLISGVGGYEQDRGVYRYLDRAEEGCHRHKSTDGVAMGEIFSLKREDGKTIYYSVEGERRYSVYPTGERYGGIFHPAISLVCDGRYMCFGTDMGRIYLFNSDSCPNQPRANAAELNQPRYSDYHSFAGHPPKWRIGGSLIHRDKTERKRK